MTENLPKAIKEEKINLAGFELIVIHLDNGQRLFCAESVENFFKKLGFCEKD